MSDSETTNLGLIQPEVGVEDSSQDWGDKIAENLETIDEKWEAVLPSTQAFGDVASAGSSLVVARADHRHGLPLLPQFYKNLLTNGGFEICQRTAPFSSPANNAYTFDKWQSKNAGGTPPTFTVAIETGASHIATGSAQSCKLTCTDVGATLSDGLYLSQKIENYKEFRGKQITLSVRVKTTLASKVKVRIKDSAGNSTSSAHTGGGTYETLTVTRTVDSSATSLLIEMGMLATGDVATSTIYFDNAMLVMGNSAADYTSISINEEMMKCLRYYQTLSLYIAGLGASDGTNYLLANSCGIHPMVATATPAATWNYVKEEGANTDEKGSYTKTVAITNAAGTGPQDWTDVRVTVSKAIAGSKPTQVSVTVVLEDA